MHQFWDQLERTSWCKYLLSSGSSRPAMVEVSDPDNKFPLAIWSSDCPCDIPWQITPRTVFNWHQLSRKQGHLHRNSGHPCLIGSVDLTNSLCLPVLVANIQMATTSTEMIPIPLFLLNPPNLCSWWKVQLTLLYQHVKNISIQVLDWTDDCY